MIFMLTVSKGIFLNVFAAQVSVRNDSIKEHNPHSKLHPRKLTALYSMITLQ